MTVTTFDRVHRLHLARRRGQERLADVAQVVERGDPLAHVGDREQRTARDRVQDAVLQRRRVQRAVEDVEEGGRRALEDAPVRRHEQRLVGALFLGDPRRQHVRRVGERLDAVEHARRRVRDRRQGDGVRHRMQVLDDPDPPSAAGDEQPQRAVGGLAALQQLLAVLADGVDVERQPQRRGAALHPLEVLLEAVRRAVVEAHDLEDAVAAQQALVGHGDLRLRDVHHVAVEDRELVGHGRSLDGHPATCERVAAARLLTVDRGVLRLKSPVMRTREGVSLSVRPAPGDRRRGKGHRAHRAVLT
jgi:hypothetical protein